MRFMGDLQHYDCLYNKFSLDFKDKYKKMNCWAALVEKHNIGLHEAEMVLKNIRTAYERYLKSRRKASVWVRTIRNASATRILQF